MDQYDYTVDKKQLGELYGKSSKTICEWINYGLPTLGKQGRSVKIDLKEAVQWREKYILGSDTLKGQGEKAALDKARRLKIELEYQVMLGNLVEIDRIESIMFNLITGVVTRLKSMPTKLAPLAHGCKTLPKLEAVIRKVLYDCITDLREFNTDNFVTKNSKGMAITADSNAKSVVRRKSKVKP